MLRRRALAYFALITAVFIWGVNFNVVSLAMVSWKNQPFTFLAARFWLATVIYAVILTVSHRSFFKAFSLNRSVAFQAAMVGFVLTAGYGLQTFYLAKRGPVGAAFLTSTTVLWAPLLAFLFGQKFYLPTLIGAFVAMIGIVLMEFAHAQSLKGAGWLDLLAIFAAIAFAIEILLVSRFAPKEKSIQWTTVSCLSVALITTFLAITQEHANWNWSSDVPHKIFAIVFTGVFATAVALGLQNWAQAQDVNQKKIIDGPRAAIISTLEPVFTTFVTVFVISPLTAAKLLSPNGNGKPSDQMSLLLAGACFLILVGTLISEIAAAKRSQREDSREPAIVVAEQ